MLVTGAAVCVLFVCVLCLLCVFSLFCIFSLLRWLCLCAFFVARFAVCLECCCCCCCVFRSFCLVFFFFFYSFYLFPLFYHVCILVLFYIYIPCPLCVVCSSEAYPSGSLFTMGGPAGWASGREGRLIPYIDTRQTPDLCEREKIMTRSTKPVPEREVSTVLLLSAAPLAASTLRKACG